MIKDQWHINKLQELTTKDAEVTHFGYQMKETLTRCLLQSKEHHIHQTASLGLQIVRVNHQIS